MKKSVLNSKIKLLKKSAGTQKCYAQRNTPGVCNISKMRKNEGTLVGLQFNHVILVVKCKLWQQTIYNQYSI